MKLSRQAAMPPTPVEPALGGALRIGALLRGARKLTDEQIEQIVDYQRVSGLRFGEAAVALRFVNQKDVRDALSQQSRHTPGFAGLDGAGELVVATDPRSEQAEVFRELRSRLLLEALAGARRSALAIVSAGAGDGRTYLAANLAASFGQLGRRTLLIDADLRAPRLHRLLGVDHGLGLSDVLAGFADASTAVQQVPGVPCLDVLPAGDVPPNPLELLQRPAFALLLRKVLHEYEHVVLDTPAALRGADARVVAALCGAALVVARRHESRMDALEGLVHALQRGPAQLAGVVMNEH